MDRGNYHRMSEEYLKEVHPVELATLLAAVNVSTESNCRRLHVGAAVRSTSAILFNCNRCPRPEGICLHEGMKPGTTKPDCSVHAEIRVMHRSSKPINSLCVTHFPCRGCADAIVDVGVKTVYYIHDYGENKSLPFLLDNGVDVVQVLIQEVNIP